MDARTMIRRSPRAVFRKLENDSGGVVLHLDSTAYHGVNEIGALIWDLIDDGVTFEDLLSQMKEAIDDSPVSLADDVAAFVQGLEERELVVLEPFADSSIGGSEGA